MRSSSSFRKGYLNEFVKKDREERKNDTQSSGNRSEGNRPILGIINTIVESMEEWATSKNKRRAYLRSVITIGGTSKRPRQEEWQINFSTSDADIIEDNENDPIAISALINNFFIERILVDDRSVVEVLMYEALERISLDESLLRPAESIYNFVN